MADSVGPNPNYEGDELKNQENAELIEQAVNASDLPDGPGLPKEPKDPKKPEPPKERLGKTVGKVAFLNIISKAFGLARDIVVMQTFGTSRITDAYYFAYMFTGNIFVLFGGLGGPFHQNTVTAIGALDDKKKVSVLTGQILLTTFAFLGLISLLIYFLAPFIVSIVVPGTGLPEPERLKLWDEVLMQFRIMIPLVVLAGLVGIGCGISNTYNEHIGPSIGPAFASVAIIIFLWLFPNSTGFYLALGTTVGAFMQFAVQWFGISKANPEFKLEFKLAPEVKKFFQNLGKASIGTLSGQLNLYIDAFFVSSLAEGSWAAIQNANRLFQLPIGILSTAMVVPILPRFVSHVKANQPEDVKKDLHKAWRILWFVVLPMSAILLALPDLIVKILFERGSFNEESRTMVVLALSFLVPSAFFYLGRDIILRAFYAHGDFDTPYKISIAALALKAVLDWALVGPMGLAGIVLSTTLVTIFNFVLYCYFLTRKIGSLGLGGLVVPTSIMIVGSVLCGLTAYYTSQFLSGLSILESANPLISMALILALSAACGGIVYLAICLLCKLHEPSHALSMVRKKFNR
ncbi:MAG: murein biosynthesis integral membrane protein MurJ [Candidatus Melainabacteria bacterium]|nr:MAG: murein biosynthesis integral membrane protein MurJ [Candidatus Melainabacteria bacterium]